jgi:hypothetical protein
MTLASGMTTEIAAYPTFVWAVLAIQWALVAPSSRRDLVALVAIGLAAFARLQMLALIPVFALAALAHEVGWAHATREAGETRLLALRTGLRAAVRRHGLLAAVVALGLVAAIGVRVSSFAGLGFYSNTFRGNLFPPGSLASARGHIAYILLGLALAPGILAFAWAGKNAALPSGKRAHAFAWLLLIAVPLLTLQVGSIAERFDPGFIQERYLFYVVPLLLVGMVASFGERRLTVPIVVAGALVALLLLGARYETSLSAFWFFDSPGLAFYFKVVANGLHKAARTLGAPGLTAVQLAAIVAGLVTVVLAALALRTPPRAQLAVVGVGLVAFLAISTRYDFQQVVYGSFGGQGFGAVRSGGTDWVDRHIPEGATVAILAAQRGDVASSRQVWWREEFWNRTIRRAYVLGSGPSYVWNDPSRRRLHFATGAFTVTEPPPYVVEPVSHTPLRLAGRVLTRSPDGRLVLLRAQLPYRATMAIKGTSDDGWLAEDRAATVRVYGSAGTRRCARVRIVLGVPRGVESARSFVVSARGPRVRGAVSPNSTRSLQVITCPAGGAGHADVRIRQPPPADPAEAGGLQLVDARVVGSAGRRS